MIDCQQVQKFAQSGATLEEIADLLGCRPAAIRRCCPREYRLSMAQRRLWIRRAQTKLVAEGSAQMMIWLGKAELAQGKAKTEGDQPEPQLDAKVG